MAEIPLRYNLATDELVPVTQEWADKAQDLFRAFGQARREAREIIEKGYVPVDSPVYFQLKAFLDCWKPEFEQKK